MGQLVVAVDGPSGSGKSSTARGVASRLGLRYLDTGAMYRAVTWALLERGVDVDEPDAVAQAAKEVRIDSGTDPSHPTIHADGIDVSVVETDGDRIVRAGAGATYPYEADLRRRLLDLITDPARAQTDPLEDL